MLVRQLLSIPGRTWWPYWKWALAHFFYDEKRVGDPLSELAAEIETRLATAEPQVEVLLVEVVSGDTLRLFIDHPDGVTLELCERVTRALGDYSDRYALEVSSPGEDRPLSKPQHFSRFLGRRAQLRLRDANDGHKNLTGELVGASEREVTIAAGDGIVTIPYELIARSNLVPGD
jgi:ribosome maturation factor RimP